MPTSQHTISPSWVLLLTLSLLSLFSDYLLAADNNLADPGQITFREAVSDTFNEQIDPYTGHLDLAYTDLHLPGNGGLDLQIIRTYKSSRVTDTAMVDTKLGFGWDIGFGKVKKNADFVTIELHDGTTSTAVREYLGSNYFITKDFWKLYMPIGGIPVLQLTDGTTITFGQGSLEGWLATEIKKNNNTISISYLNGILDKATYKAGGSSKTISFHYSTSGKKHLQSISWGSPVRQITYGYPSATANAVTSVNLPGGDIWKYSYQQKSINLRSAYILQTVTTPWGGSVTYDFDTYGKPVGLSQKSQGGLSSKQVSGRGLVNGIWNYDYRVDPDYDVTTITDSCGKKTTYTFYGYGSSFNNDCYKYGLQVSKVVMNGSSHELTTAYEWDKLSDPISAITYSVLGLCNDLNATYVPVLTSETITRGGKTYKAEYSSYDDYGSPGRIVERGTNTKTTTIDYWHDTTRNIVKNKPLTIVTTGDSQFGGSFTTTYSYYDNASADSNYYGEIETASPNGVTTSYTYGSNGNIVSITDANNNSTYYQWSHGAISRIENPYYYIQRTINWDGTVASETNGRNYTTSYKYDGAMRVTEIDPPIGNKTTKTYEYDSNGYFTSVKEQRGNFFTRTLYDGLKRKTGTTNSLNIQTSTEYSSCGVKTQTSSNIGDTTEFDNFGRPTRIVHKDNEKILFHYQDDLHLQITDEGGYVSHQYFSSFGSPESVFLTKVIDAAEQTTQYTYNILGSLTQAYGLGRVDSYSYDSKNFLTLETHPASGTTVYTRDHAGNLETLTDSLGTRTYTYDDINRLKSISSSVGGTMMYEYDKTDNISSSISPYCATTHKYDASNRLTETERTIQDFSGITESLSYGYDANDNLTSIKYPNGMLVEYDYNSLNQITSVTGFGADIHGITYSTTGNDIGLMRQYTRSNGQVVTFSYDTRRLPSRSSYSETDLGYNFDVRGNLKNLYNYKNRSKDKTFNYDSLNRLAQFNGPWGIGEYRYSPSGDRTEKIIGGVTTSYNYFNHLLLGDNYAFNGDGDLTRNGDNTFEYDGFHHLKLAARNGGNLAEYGYDSTSRRVYKSTGDATTVYFNDSRGNTLSENTGAGRYITNLIYVGDKLVSKVTYNQLDSKNIHLANTINSLKVVTGGTLEALPSLEADVNGDNKIGVAEAIYSLGNTSNPVPIIKNEIFFYDTDYLGTPITLTDSLGNVVWQVDELPFGEEYEEEVIPETNNHRYLGKKKDDETGFLYFGPRYMEAEDGRFTSIDPIVLVDPSTGKINIDILYDPQSLNRYAYSLNNPYRYTDPDGEPTEATFIERPSIAVGLDSLGSNI